MKPEGPLHMAISLLAVQYTGGYTETPGRRCQRSIRPISLLILLLLSNIWEVAGGLLTNSNGRDSFFSQSAFRLSPIPDDIIPQSCSLEGIVVEPLN